MRNCQFWVRGRIVLLAISWVGWTAAARGDWPQFRGPTHNGVADASERLSPWPLEGPNVIWRVPLGEAYSGMTVARGRVYTMVLREKQELLVALDPASGAELWSKVIDTTVFDPQGNGPRSTPTIDGDRIYVTSSFQKLICLSAEDGADVWMRDIRKEYRGQGDNWGYASSPMIDGGRIFLCAGGKGQSLLAFDKTSGELAWKGQDDGITHSTPTPATIHGVRQIIFHTRSGLVAVAPDTGAVLWRFPYKHTIASPSSPVIAGDIVYVSAEYGIGAGACRVVRTDEGFAAEELWRRRGELENHWSTPTFYNGHIFGLYPKSPPGLRCIDPVSGRDLWVEGGLGGAGVITAVDDKLLVLNQNGTLVMVQATHEGYRELARTQAVGAKCWAFPAVSGGRIYLRSDKQAVCLEP